MDGIVSARRLRKSYLNKFPDIDVDVYNNTKYKPEKVYENYNIEKAEKSKKILKLGVKSKILIKMFLCLLILFSSLLCKLVFYEQIKTNKYFLTISNEYNKEYKKQDVLLKIENISRNLNKTFNYAIPTQISEYVKNKYQAYKVHVLEFKLKETIVNVFNNKKDQKVSSNNEVNNEDENTGIGGGGPINEESDSQTQDEIKTYESNSSSINSMEENVNKILEKKISIIQPTKGTITSRYGAREQIFDNVDPYHTGIDIANKMNTNIISATTGKVVTVEQNNKYYGKMVEIQTDEVIFKYGHMNEIKVKQGQEIKQGDIVGLMGKTGYATGSHLHFEIRINNKSVDPEKILKFNT